MHYYEYALTSVDEMHEFNDFNSIILSIIKKWRDIDMLLVWIKTTFALVDINRDTLMFTIKSFN